MSSIIRATKDVGSAAAGPLGIAGFAIEVVRAAIWLIEKAADVDFLGNNFGLIGAFLDSGIGICATVFIGLLLIAFSIYRGLRATASQQPAPPSVCRSPGARGNSPRPSVRELQPSPTFRAFDKFREAQTLELLNGRPLSLDIGECGEFFQTSGRLNLYTHQRTLNVKIINNDRTKSLSGCKVKILDISPHEYNGPWILREDFSLAAGDHIFVPLASYVEADDPKKTPSGSTFFEILSTKNRPKPAADGEHVISLRATALDTAYYDLKCKLWVDENDRLRVAKVN